MFTSLQCTLLHLILVSSITTSIQISASEQNADIVPPSSSLWDSGVYASIMAELTRPRKRLPALPQQQTTTTIALVAILTEHPNPESKIPFHTDTKTIGTPL